VALNRSLAITPPGRLCYIESAGDEADIYRDDFFVRDLRDVLFFAVLFFLVAVELRLDALFFVAFFLCGFGGMFAPERRASLKPIAIACFGFFTFPPRPDLSS
jgi:hypothetical protein